MAALATRPRNSKYRNGTGKPRKTREELKADARTLAASGNSAGDILRMLSQYDVTADQVQEWIA